MKNLYKTIIACIITAIITGCLTAYLTSNYYTNITGDEYTCTDNASPDINGCCPGEELKDMGDSGFNCCPLDGGDCFPPISKNS